ncbi:PEP-CTERM sorting domain-containing protein [Crocosphaera sp. UHCC 0190]|uniref:PEP-CTERM sorting domain-containing protein n=1 Tax=Crocosphaera sp. UHCC 0190 TaxID=3110246 RepID=UPI002B1FF1A3|nr:PEP-CTERM sorting domain-containing protein [Crocosphaera sp. UHCC 0190]MEA5511323.1 PEP-CTERM sorting domain-containing protein [Crocosphaera sp. UHCC 0190]
MNLTLKTLTAVASGSIAASTMGGIAEAAQLNANMGFTGFGTGTTFVGPNLAAATSIDFPALNVVNLNTPTYQAPGSSVLPNDFYDASSGGTAGAFQVNLASIVVINNDPLNLSAALPFSVDFTAGGNPATFTASSFFRSSANSNSLDLFFLGTITGTGFDDSNASLSFAFTTVGGIVNYSATLASPPDIVPTPEPTTIVGLLAVGAASLASRRRKS